MLNRRIWPNVTLPLLCWAAWMMAASAHAQDPHFINDFVADGGWRGQPADVWLLERERSPGPVTWDWPRVDPGSIDSDGLPAVLDVPQPPSPPEFPGGGVGGYPALPEPGSVALLALGGALLLRRSRRRR